MMKYEAERFLKMDCVIGEVPVWDDETGKFYFVDILRNHIHVYHRVNESVSTMKTIDTGQSVGCIVLRKSGGVIAGLVDGIYSVDEETGEKALLLHPENGTEGNRYNDGKCDPAGRFWVGTMSRSLDSGFGDYTPRGALYCIGADLQYAKKAGPVAISNGLAWNAAQDTFFYIDSPTKKVVSYAYHHETGDLSNPRVVLDFHGMEGIPDGMCIDVEDNLWIAFFDGGCVRHCDPQKGKIIDEVRVPARSVTCAAFGGQDFCDLLITTGTANTDLKEYPDAGSVFKIRAKAPGFATSKFIG